MSLAKDILNDSKTIDELMDDPNRGFFFTQYVSFSYKTGSYNRIMQNIEVMPEDASRSCWRGPADRQVLQ